MSNVKKGAIRDSGNPEALADAAYKKAVAEVRMTLRKAEGKISREDEKELAIMEQGSIWDEAHMNECCTE